MKQPMSDVQEFLARIRKTVEQSDQLIESARLRMAETDRMLDSQGLTREQVMNMKFSPEQRRLVDDELRRLGLPSLEDIESDAPVGDKAEATAAAAADDLSARSRGFGSLMHGIRL